MSQITRRISTAIDDFALFLGPARMRALFLVIALTGLVSLILNAFKGDWVTPVQSVLVLVAVAGAAIIIGGKLDEYERGRWAGILAPAVGLMILAVLFLPQYALALFGAAAGWVVAGGFLFRARGPVRYQEAIKALRRSDYAEAVKSMDILIKQEPRKPEHYRFRAELLRLWGKLDKARKDYQHMTELDPKSAVAYNGLAEVYLQSGDYEKARESGIRAFELAPDEWVALYNLGMIEDRLGDSQDVVDHLKKAVSLGVPDARHRLLIYLYLARAYARLGNSSAAQDAVIQVRKQKNGLEEWQKILESDQAETLRDVLGEDVAAANNLVRGKLDVMALASG